MSTFKVPLLKIQSVIPHPNADRLDLALVAESPVVVGKGVYRAGDTVVYVPVGAVLPSRILQDLEASGSKISIPNGRIKAARIRGVVSQGLILDPKKYKLCSAIGAATVGEAVDVSKELGIVKYEEAVRSTTPSAPRPRRMRPGNPNFRYYTDIENFKHYPHVLQEGEPVWVTEKLHGTSFRCGWFPKATYTWWEKVKQFFGYPVDEWEFCYGSRKVDITASPDYRGFYGDDVYGKMVKKLDMRNRIPKGYAVYGEICGPGIQKGYDYGLKQHELFVYDILDTWHNVWIDAEDSWNLAYSWGFNPVPLILSDNLAIHHYSSELCKQLSDKQMSLLHPETVREGIVVKPVVERVDPRLGRVILKVINPEYLLKDTTEYQ